MNFFGKSLILYFLFSLFSFNLQSQNNFEKFPKDLIRQNKIKSITEWSHSYQGGNFASKGTKNNIATFDRQGILIEERFFNSRGNETRKVTYRYDLQGNLVEHTVFEAKFNRITFSRLANFNASGVRLSEWGFDGLGNYRNNYILDNSGRINEIHFTTQNRLTEKRIFKYSGLETEITILSQGTIPTGKIFLKHNRNNKLIEESEVDASGNLLRKVTFDFNNAGQLVKESRFRGSNLSYINRFNYNPAGQLISIENAELSSDPIITHKFSYDAMGRLSEEQWYSGNVQDFSHKKYQYDRNGKIISMDCFFVSYNFRVMYKFTFEYF